jgi:multiple sugar transport system permease protein
LKNFDANKKGGEAILKMLNTKKKFDKSKILRGVIVYVTAIIIVLVFFFPILYMIHCSFQPTPEAIFMWPLKIIPSPFGWKNFSAAFELLEFVRSLANTLVIMVGSGVLTISCSVLVAYGFARYPNKYSETIFMVLLSTMMLPWIVTMVPSFVLFKLYGWIGTRLPLIAPAFGGGAYTIYMIRNFMRGIPRVLDEAAEIDGCSGFRILWNIMLPNMTPILITLVVFTVTGKWSDYVGPSIFLLKRETYTLSLALASMRSLSDVYEWNVVMAACILITAPLLVLLFAAQNVFTKGIVTTAVKG